jgi:5-deoxy-glucuronate isomerase
MTYRGSHVGLDIVTIGENASHAVSAPSHEEAVVVLLAGHVEFDGRSAHRDSVFGTHASAVYMPPGSTAMIDAKTDAELAVVTTIACDLTATGDDIVFIAPSDVEVHERGRPGWQRAVHDIVAEKVEAQRLIVGETFNEPGQWSSFPPHKHDGGDGEPALEEVYYYRFDIPDGFGFQGLYESDGSERAVFLRHGTIVGIPRGYHPVCAAPGYRLYYLWALVGEPRRLAMHEDPAHRWLSE